MKNELKIARDSAVEAGKIILSYYRADYEIKDKGYHNPVTTADHAADKVLKEILTGSFPDYGWLSEETIDSKLRLKKEKVWVVDPLDGTKEFIEGVPHFVVSVALVENGIPIIGVLYNPVTKELFSAAKGIGAKLNGKTINCTSKKNLSKMVILNSRSETKKGLWDQMTKEVPEDVVHLFTAVGRHEELAKAIDQRCGGVVDIINLPADTPGDLLQDIRVLESPGSS